MARPMTSRCRRLQFRRQALVLAAAACLVSVPASRAWMQACSGPPGVACDVDRRSVARCLAASAIIGIVASPLEPNAFQGVRILSASAAEEAMFLDNENMPGLLGKNGKKRIKAKDFRLLPSGLQVKEIDPGRSDAQEAKLGDYVVITWEGYTINYFGRPFETRSLQKVSQVQPDPVRFKVGDGTMIPGIDEGVRGMREEGIRQFIIPVELGYDAEKKLGPRPSTFSGQRALDFVMDNQGLVDKTLLINIGLKRVYQK
ncbi:unnamed protein product [Polarella glacialis]|uniref:peptidylprolyl isomerase n=1 Tax=Polarella glacialis TaxID=89957 RepID=A0A813ESB4_POLGL|nr:unnamed protein product [Polarella glacialis]